ncbi:hypothetical protein ACHAQK_004457 [Fusarium lateritium]
MQFQKPSLPPKAPRSTPKAPNVAATHDLDFYVHPHLVPDQDPCKGRLLRATGPIQEGTVVLVDTAYAIVPSVTSDNEPLICSNLSCSRRVPQNGRAVRCADACCKDVVWCNIACRATDKTRHDFECSWLKKHADALRRKEGEYNFATIWHVIRLLATWNVELHSNAVAQHRYPWEIHFLRGWKAVDMCCAYLDSWPEPQITYWKRLVDEYLSDASVMSCLLSADEMLSLLCKEETNTFGLYPRITGSQSVNDRSISRGEMYGMALYPRAAQFNHSCLPNVTHKPDGEARMVYTAARDIAKDEECMITYFDQSTQQDVSSRQYYTEEQFRFKCTCDRCLEEEAESNRDGMDSLPLGF